jgi:hypothetical protein
MSLFVLKMFAPMNPLLRLTSETLLKIFILNFEFVFTFKTAFFEKANIPENILYNVSIFFYWLFL